MADISEIIGKLQVLRLNTLPPYTYDGDEGQRSEEEYLSFFDKQIDKSIAAHDKYINGLQVLVDNRDSERAFNDYLAARRLLIKFYPFCADELPAEDDSEYTSFYHGLRSAVRKSKQAVFSAADLQFLKEFRDLLVSLREGLRKQ